MKGREFDPRRTDPGDPAGRSFTWRRMAPWQIGTLAIAAVVLAIAGLVWVW